MADHNSYDELDDLEFERLFASLDDVRASESLKASTLDAIFAQADGSSDMRAEKAKERRFVLVEGTARAEGARHDAAQEDVTADPAGNAPTTGTRVTRKRSSFMLRVAAALLVLALAGGGTAACALPATHVYATAGETTFDLGVNLFGITVSAEADSDEGVEILEDVDVRYESFEEAFDRILEAYEQRGGEDAPTVRVESSVPFGGSERLEEEAQNVMDTHEWSRDEQEIRGGEASDGGASQDEPTMPRAPEQRAPEATTDPNEQTTPTDDRADGTDTGQLRQDIPNQGGGQISDGAAGMDGGDVSQH